MIQTNLGKLIAQCLEKELKIKLEREFLMHGMEKIDYFYESKKLRILVEVELRRQDPVNNVVKAWKILEGVKNEKQSFLLHFFSGKYSRTHSKYLNAVFIGNKMQEARIAYYTPILLKAKPPSGSYGIFPMSDEDKKDVIEKIRELRQIIKL